MKTAREIVEQHNLLLESLFADDFVEKFKSKIVAMIEEYAAQFRSLPIEQEQITNEFNYFENHGDDDGLNWYTICYGDPDEDVDYVIVGTTNTGEEAEEMTKRLNEILSNVFYKHCKQALESSPEQPEAQKKLPDYNNQYKKIAESEWFKKAYEGKSLREPEAPLQEEQSLEYIVKLSVMDRNLADCDESILNRAVDEIVYNLRNHFKITRKNS